MALGYQVAIFNVWWRRGEVDTRFFSSKSDQKTYFDSKTLYWNPLNNFNINDNITTMIIFRDSSGRSIADLLKCNYAIVKDSNNNYRYFFITSIKQDSGGQIIVSLDLDDIQNNLIGNLTNFSPVLIKRWNGFNYIKDASNNKYYDFSDAYKSYISTEDSPVLYNKSTEDIVISFTEDTNIDKWLNDNVECWRYVFVNDNQNLIAPLISSRNQYQSVISMCLSKVKSRTIINHYGAISCPIYKEDTTKRIYIKFEFNSTTYYYKLDNLDGFFNIQADSQLGNYPIGKFGIEEKISNIPPVDYIGSMQIDGDGDLIINANLSSGEAPVCNGTYFYMSYNPVSLTATSKDTAMDSVASGYYQSKSTYLASAPINLGINDEEYTNVKLFDFNYYKIRLRIANQHYDYNALAYLNNVIQVNGRLSFEYTEVLKVGISKIYLRLRPNGEYKSPNSYDYTGLITSLDLTEPILTNQWQDYLASHKNYYMQTAFNNTIGLFSGLGKAMGTGDNYKALVGSFNTGMDFMSDVLNQQWERENMQATPNSLSNANGDPYFNAEVSGIKPKLDILDMANNTKLLINQKLNKEGYDFNRIVDIASIPTIMDLHKNYEAVSFVIDKINTNISEKEYERLKNKCASLNRYWHTDDISYANIMTNNVKD